LHTESVVVDTVAVDRLFHLIPQANLLITVPMSNDRIVLRKLDLDEAVARSEKPLLFVRSPAELAARPRRDLVHQVQEPSSKGAVRFELTSGPKDLNVTPEGELKWRVPLDGGRKEHETILTVSDSSRRQLFHTIRIKVE
jgi:hypothetical protein